MGSRKWAAAAWESGSEQQQQGFVGSISRASWVAAAGLHWKQTVGSSSRYSCRAGSGQQRFLAIGSGEQQQQGFMGSRQEQHGFLGSRQLGFVGSRQ